MAAVRVGEKIDERPVGLGRPIPDDVVGAAADGGVVVAARHRIAEQLLAFRQAECVVLEYLAAAGRHVALVDQRAPGDVAGIERLRLRQILLAHGGAHAIGTDQEIGALARAVGEDGGDAVVVLLDAAQIHVEPIALARQRVAQRVIEPPPAAHGAHGRPLQHDAAVAVEADDVLDLDAHRVVEIDAGAVQNFDELRMRAEADAAARQLLGIALEHDDVPADAAHQVRGDQPAERAADHQRARLLIPLPLVGRG